MPNLRFIDRTPGHLIVFEGLDGAGKTTQAQLFTDHDNVLVVHQPSGAPGVGDVIYEVLEKRTDLNYLARNFLHLACHAQHYQDVIVPALESGKHVLMDRNWWSAVAYTWSGGLSHTWELPEFIKMVTLPTMGWHPSAYFLFNKPYVEDDHNTPPVQAGYSVLAARYPQFTWTVPGGTVEEVYDWLCKRMISVGVAVAA
jgi:hypothetical protein